jgi:hypothetical protein
VRLGQGTAAPRPTLRLGKPPQARRDGAPFCVRAWAKSRLRQLRGDRWDWSLGMPPKHRYPSTDLRRLPSRHGRLSRVCGLARPLWLRLDMVSVICGSSRKEADGIEKLDLPVLQPTTNPYGWSARRARYQPREAAPIWVGLTFALLIIGTILYVAGYFMIEDILAFFKWR